MKAAEIVIIGAGPAGVSAAIEAAENGVSVSLIDENEKPGGQIYRQLPNNLNVSDDYKVDKHYIQGKKLIAELESHIPRIDLLKDSLVWGVFPDKEVCIIHDGQNEEIRAKKLILADGAYDRPLPFPGWTLPGVYSTGGALRMVKTQGVLPGEKVLLAGTGPLQLVLAAALTKAGADVVAILEAVRPTAALKCLPRFWGQWELAKDGLTYLWAIRRGKIPYYMSHTILEARGDGEVKEAVFVKVDRDGKTIPGTEKKMDVDAICCGYGLIPSTRLARLCGCELRYNQLLSSWLPCHDKNMQTGLPGVFVAGDGAGIGGAPVAMAQGRIAAINACQQLERISIKEAERRSKPVFRRLKGLMRFESTLNEVYSVRSDLFERITDDTIVCRCEDITAGEIRHMVADGARDINDIKKLTRVGMGHCQGRMCESSIARILSIETKQPISEIGYFGPRPPVKPFPLGVLAKDIG